MRGSHLLKLGRCLLPAQQGHITPHLRFLASLPVGPDRLLPATSLTSTTPEVAVVRRPVPHPDYDYSPKWVSHDRQRSTRYPGPSGP